MDRSRLDATALEFFRDPIGAMFRAGKHEHRIEFGISQKMQK